MDGGGRQSRTKVPEVGDFLVNLGQREILLSKIYAVSVSGR